MRKIFILLALSYCFFAFSQDFKITGKVFDKNAKPILDATVFLLKQKDSSIVNYTSTSRDGFYELPVSKSNEPSFFKVSADNYKEYSKKFDKIDGNIKMEDVKLAKDSVTNISGITLQGSPPVKVKKDTLEFNASSFKVKLDGKAEDLIKSLPGFEITNDGKIMANGKEVKEILVNGKPFFDKNGQIALKNLPADLIKKIQVTTQKTNEEKVNGEKAKSQDLSVNLTLDEKKSKGLMGRIYAGIGSDKRYEGSTIINYFKKNTKISLLASSNNINVQGFKSDEVYNSMGFGRNATFIQGGTFIQDGDMRMISYGSNDAKGILKSTMVGVNYADQLAKGADLESLSLVYLNNSRESRSVSDRTTLLNDYTLRTMARNQGENDSQQYSLDNGFRIKLSENDNLYFSNSFSNNNTTNIATSSAETYKNGQLLNTNDSYNKTDSENNNFDSNIFYSKKISKKGRRINFGLNSSVSEAVSKNLTKSETLFDQDPNQNILRNQIFNNKTISSSFNNSISYTEPINDSATISLNLAYRTKYNRSGREVNDFDSNTGDYSAFNSILSNRMTQQSNQFIPKLNFNMNKKKINMWASTDLAVTNMKINAQYQGTNYSLNKNFLLPSANLNMWVNDKGKNYGFYTNASFSMPTAQQLTPYVDESNPLVKYRGNPDLKNSWNAYGTFYYRNFNQLKNTNFSVSISANTTGNRVVSNSIYNANTGTQDVTYANMNGNYGFNVYSNYSKTFKWDKNKLTVAPKFSVNYYQQKGLINGDVYQSKSYSAMPGLNLAFDVKERMTIKPSYSLNYSQNNYTNYVIDKSHTTSNVFGLQSINYFGPNKNLTFENDFTYTTNSNITPGFKKDFYFWNSSLGYIFMKKQMTAKIMVYDVLNQNQSVKRVITDTYIEDREDLILKRYIMFTLSYQLNKFGSKK